MITGIAFAKLDLQTTYSMLLSCKCSLSKNFKQLYQHQQCTEQYLPRGSFYPRFWIFGFGSLVFCQIAFIMVCALINPLSTLVCPVFSSLYTLPHIHQQATCPPPAIYTPLYMKVPFIPLIVCPQMLPAAIISHSKHAPIL